MNNSSKAPFPHSFGVFSPTGYVLMAFADESSAEQARLALIKSGFLEKDVIRYSRQEVMAELDKSEEHANNPLQIGQEVEKIDRYIELAKQGAGFLVVHAPEDEASKRALDLVRPFKLKLAEKYNRLTLEELA